MGRMGTHPPPTKAMLEKGYDNKVPAYVSHSCMSLSYLCLSLMYVSLLSMSLSCVSSDSLSMPASFCLCLFVALSLRMSLSLRRSSHSVAAYNRAFLITCTFQMFYLPRTAWCSEDAILVLLPL